MTEEEDRKRRIVAVPGETLEAATIVRANGKYLVLALSLKNSMIIVFDSPGGTTARMMSVGEAEQFIKDIKNAYLALHDDYHIKRMEKEFSDGEVSDE